MRARAFLLMAVMVVVASAAAHSQGVPDTCAVTYVANEGFMVETQHSTVLIDALFGNIKGNWCEQPGDSLLAKLISGSAPFDDVDALLVTHKHVDHFNEGMVVDFLKNHPRSVLICPDQVGEMLRKNAATSTVSGRIHALKSGPLFDTTIAVGGARIRALRINHGAYLVTDSATGTSRNIHADVENLAYLIESDGWSVLHTGDGSPSSRAQFTEYGFARREFDAVLVDRTFLRREGLDLLAEQIRTKNLILMHVEPGRSEYYRTVTEGLPEAFVFSSPLEKKILLK